MFVTTGETVLFAKPTPINTIAEIIEGNPTSIARLCGPVFFVTINVSNPAAMEAIAALALHLLNIGTSPRINGMAVGPSSAANQFTINPSTPPNRS